MVTSAIPTRALLGSRALFPDLEARAYLAHAAISPTSIPVRHAVAKIADDYAREGVRAFPVWAAQRDRLRNMLGQLLHARPQDVALTAGTTRGITDLALAIPWRRGDRILCFAGEFPANTTPWQQAAELFGLEVIWQDAASFRLQPDSSLEQLEHTLRRGVRLVAVSAVQFQTGFRMPLESMGQLCRAHGAELAVDAIQACGAIPTDVQAWHADYVTSGAHKWLMGLEGAGFLWIHPDRVSALRPHTAGWLSHESAIDFLFAGPGLLRYDRPLRKTATVFEGSTPNAVGFAALEASLALLIELGIPSIFAHLQAYHDQLESALLDQGFVSLRAPHETGRSGSLCVELPPHLTAPEVQRILLHSGIVTSIPDGQLRFAPHWPNSLDEVPAVLAALTEIG